MRTPGGGGRPRGTALDTPERSPAVGDAPTTLSPSRDPVRILLALLLFVTVSRIHQEYPILGALHPGLLLFGGAAGYALLKPTELRVANIVETWPPRVVAALVALACISVPFGMSMGASGVFMIESYSKVVLTFFLMVVAIRKPGDLYLFVWAYVLACGFLVYTAIFGFGLEQAGGMRRLGDLHMYDANDLGVILVVGLPLSLVTFRNAGPRGRFLSGVIMLGIGASLARSGSRGGFLGLIAVGAVMLVLMRGLSVVKRAGAVLAVVLGLVVMAPTGYWDQMRTLTDPTDDYNWESPYGRRAVAERGIGYMWSHPLTGVGLANFGRAEWLLSSIAQERQRRALGWKLTAAHNSFVQVGAELGIPGLVVFCMLLFGTALRVRRLWKGMRRGWTERGPPWRFVHDMALLLPVAFVGFAVTGFFVSWAYLDLPYLLAAMGAGVQVCARRLAPAVHGPGADARSRSLRSPRRGPQAGSSR